MADQETMEPVDVVVVGGGLAGLTVANRVAERGLRVSIIEQGETESYLCNSRIASGAFNLAHSDPTLEPAVLRDAIMSDTEGAADPALAEAVAGIAGAAMQWLRAEGAKFIKVQRPGRDRAGRWRRRGRRAPASAGRAAAPTRC